MDHAADLIGYEIGRLTMILGRSKYSHSVKGGVFQRVLIETKERRFFIQPAAICSVIAFSFFWYLI